PGTSGRWPPSKTSLLSRHYPKPVRARSCAVRCAAWPAAKTSRCRPPSRTPRSSSRCASLSARNRGDLADPSPHGPRRAGNKPDDGYDTDGGESPVKTGALSCVGDRQCKHHDGGSCNQCRDQPLAEEDPLVTH